MEKEVINQRQAILILSTFIIGSSAVLGTGAQTKQDVWLTIIIAMAAASLVMAVYGRISKLFPGKNFYEILDFLFGKVFGKIISSIFVFYALHLGALILRDFAEFIRIVSLQETPGFIFAISAVTITIFAVRSGIENLGRFIAIFFPILTFAIVAVTLLSAPLFNFNNLKPVLYNGIIPVLDASFHVFGFPFGETVLFLCLMGSIRKNSSAYKIYYISLLIGGIFLIIISVRSILVLGVPSTLIQNFASFASTRLIKVGSFFQRIEATVAITFMISGFTKSTVCLYSATKGIAQILNIKDYRTLAGSLGILMALSSMIIHKDAVELLEWTAKIYSYYAIPFQIIIPLIVWITAEIKTRTSKKSKNEEETEETNKEAIPSRNPV